MNQKITYNIGYNVDTSGLQRAKQELTELSNMSFKEFQIINPNATQAEFNKVKADINELSQAIDKAFNPKLNTINIATFRNEIGSSTQKMRELEASAVSMGAKGRNAFIDMTAQLLTTQKHVKQTSKFLDSMAKTFANTVKWSIASGALNLMTGTLQKAWSYSKNLDASLNDIRIVTGKSADEMERFAKQANKAAKGLGAGTTNYTKAALIYYQQGLEEQDVQARSNVTVKAANVTGQSASEVSEQLTAVWNGYKVVAEEAELYVDKLAAVAAETAADLEELSTGMSKVASAAHTMGVDVDQLSAQLSTIISVTRQDANVVGTALKTIYARMGDLKVDGVDEFGTSLGEVSSQMKQMGINVVDESGNLRDMGTVIEEVAAKWGTWTDAQQQAAAVAIAGKRQYNNLIALFENWDMYESSKNISQTSAGTLQKQQEIYLDSLEAKLKKLSTAGEKVFDAMFESDSMYDFLDALTFVVERVGNLIESIGGGGNMLIAISGLLTRMFSTQIAQGIGNIRNEFALQSRDKQELIAQQQLQNDLAGTGNKITQNLLELKEKELKYSKYLTDEQRAQIKQSILNVAEKEKELNLEKERVEKLNKFRKERASGRIVEDKNLSATAGVYRDAKGQIVKPNSSGLRSATVNTKTKELEAIDLKNQLEDLKAYEGEAIAAVKNIATAKKDITSLINDPSLLTKNGNVKYQVLKKDGTISDANVKKVDQRRQDLESKLSGMSDKKSPKAKQHQAELQSIQKLQQAIEKLRAAEEQRQNAIKKLSTSQGVLSTEQQTQIESLDKAYRQGSISLDKFKKAVIDLTGASEKEFEDMIHQLTEVSDKTEECEKNLKDAKDAGNGIFDGMDFQTAAEGMSKWIGNTTMMLSGIQSLTNAFKLLGDETLSDGEKIEQFIMALLSGLGMLVPTVLSSVQTIKTANQTAGAASQSAWGWIGLLATAVVGLISLAVSISKAIPKSKSELEKAQEAFDKAQSSAKEAKEILNDLRVEYKNLFDEVEKYDNARLAIDDMRAGTEEWKLAVQELNYELLDTIEKYPILADYLKSSNEYGIEILSLEEGAWDAALKSQQDKISKQQMTTAYSNVNVIKNQADLLQEQYYNQDVKKWAGDTARALGLYTTDLRDSSKIALYIGAAYKDTEEWSSGTQDFAERRERAYKDLFDMDSEGSLANTLRSDYGGNLAYIDAELDLTKLMDKSVIELQTLQDNIQANTDLTDQEKTALIDLIETTKETKESIDRNTEQLKKAEYDFYKQVAEEKGINSTIFANVASKTKSPDAVFDEDGEDDDLIRANSGSGENATLRKIKYDWETKQYVLTEDGTRAATDKGEKIETKIQAEEVAGVKEWIDSIVQPLFGENVKPDDYGALSGVETANLMSHKISVHGSEYTIRALINMTQAALALQMASSQQEDLISAMQTVQQRGQLEESVYFDERWYDPNFQWVEGTLDKYNQIINQAEGKTQENAETEKQNFIGRIEKQFAKTGIELFSTDENGNKILNEKFNYLTEDQSKILSKQILQADFAGANGAIAKLINSITDPQQMADAVAAISKVTNWNDASQISDLRLALHDIGIEITDENVWNSFFEKISSGMNKWIQDAKKVSETLAFIRDTVAGISFGDVIDDETYKQIIKEYPEAVTKFIKTAEGWISLVDGKALSTEMKGAYSNLDELTEKYSVIRDKAGQLRGDANLSEKIVSSGSGAAADAFLANISIKDRNELLSALGYNISDFKTLYNMAFVEGYGTEEEKRNAFEQIKPILLAINQAAIDVAEGRYTSEEARELYATAVADSWDQVKNSGALVDDENDETNKKIIAYWGNKFREEIGVGFNWGQALSVDELEELAQTVHKRELDYYGEVSNKLDLLDRQLENAFGADKITLLKRQGSLNRENLEIAEKTYNRESALYEKIISDNSIFAGLLDENGELDIAKALDRQAEIGDAEDAEYKTIQAAIDASNAMNEAYVLQKEYVNAALDAQIEAFNYAFEIQQQFLEIKNLSQEIKQNFEDWSSGSFKVFDELSVTNIIKNSLSILESKSAVLDSNFDALMQIGIQAKYESASEERAEANKELTIAKTNYDKGLAQLKKDKEFKRVESQYNTALKKQMKASAKASLFDNIEEFKDILYNSKGKAIDIRTKSAIKKELQKYENKNLNELSAEEQQALRQLNIEKIIRDNLTASGLTENWFRALLNSKNADKLETERTKAEAAKVEANQNLAIAQEKVEAKGAIVNDDGTLSPSQELYDQLIQAQVKYDQADELYNIVKNGSYVGADGLFNAEAYSEDFEKWINEAKDNLEEMKNTLQEMYEVYFQVQEELMGLFDSQIDRLSKLNSVLSSSVNLWKLINVNSEKSAKTISSYYKAMESNTKESYELSLGKLAVAQEEYDKLFIIAEDGTRRLKESISNEMVETVRENLQAATDEVVAAASEWMDIISEQYNEELSAIINDFMKKATGMDLTELTEDWNLYKEREDFYLDDINSAYSIDEIERNFKKSIDETDNLAAQNKMKKVMEEQLKILREKDKLSQYDLDRANAMYELTLKQIALEEAQQTASKMKLTRDASGNYSYQYVSDMDEIAKAEEELAKAQNDLYNLDKERNTSLVEDYYTKMKEAEQKIAEARAANDSARVEALQNAYFGPGGVLDSIKNELGLAEENLAEMSQKLTGNDDFVHSLSEYTNAIAASDLGQLAESIRELTEESFKLTEHITIDAAGNEVIVSTLDELFGKDSILTSAIAAIKESVVDDKSTLDIDTKSLQESSSAILTEVPKLVSSVGTLSEKLQQYVNVYTEWLGKQVGNSSEIGQNTEALIGLRTSIDGLSNRIDNVKVNSGDSDSSETNLDLYD